MKHLFLLILSAFILGLTSCGALVEGQEVRDPITGAVISNDSVKADQQTVDTLFSKARRLIKGDEVKDVLLEPSK